MTIRSGGHNSGTLVQGKRKTPEQAGELDNGEHIAGSLTALHLRDSAPIIHRRPRRPAVQATVRPFGGFPFHPDRACGIGRVTDVSRTSIMTR